MFALRKVWFKSPHFLALAKLDKHERISRLKSLEFHPFNERHELQFYFSPMPLIAETARRGTLGGRVITFDTEEIPVLPKEVLQGVKTGELDLAEVQFDVDPEQTASPFSPEEIETEYTIFSAFAICFDDIVVRIGNEEEMAVALEAFNAVVARCETAVYLDNIEYSDLFTHYTSGANWMALDDSIRA